MASDIVITPSRGSTTVNAKIDFTGASTASSQIRLEVLPDNSLSFVGTTGSLFSIADSVTGSLMSVNDASGLPILEVFDTDKVVMGQYNQNTLVVNGTQVGIGTGSPTNKLTIAGVNNNGITLTGTNATITSAGASPNLILSAGTNIYLRPTSGYNVIIDSGNGLQATSGTITGARLISNIATGTAPLTVTSTTLVTNLNADLVDGLHVHTGRNNVANQIVRTDADGYIQAGWINTISGDNGTTAIDRVYASSDAYIRTYTPTNFRTVLNVPTRTGGDASGTWGISVTGNAGTATTLQTARNLTINGTAKSFNGSADISWTAAEIGLTSYLPLTGGTISSNLAITGNLTVNGTTTTVNSTTVTIDDPIFTLGGDTAPASDDNKDRGIEFRWHNGTAAKVGFFGYDDSTGYFTFIPDSTNTSEVFSGTQGDIQASNFRGALIGNASTATTLQTARNIAGVSFNGSADITITGQNITTSSSAASNDIEVAKYLRWKNYGNNHILIDASAGTNPGGGAIDKYTPANTINSTGAGGSTWGEAISLMGWNGSATYGVRVDRARSIDNQANSATTTAASTNTANQIVLRDGSGNFSAGAITATSVSVSADQAIVNQHNGNASQWYGRILSKNSTSDKAAFLGTYGSVAGVFAHNNALTTWADLYINTVDGSSGGTVRMPSSVLVNGNQVLHAGNYTTYVGNGTLTLAVSGTGLSGSASFTANQSGNTTFTVTSNATSANTASTIVARDASGNFSAGTVSVTKLNVAGDSYINFNNEEAAWGIRSRNALSTTNLTTNLKNIIYNGGGLSEGLAIKGAEYLGITAMEIQNNGTVWSYASMRSPIFYDSNNTAYYCDPASTSVFNRLEVAGYPVRSSATIDMSNTATYATTNFYPVTIPLLSGMPTRMRIVNALNSNVPSWSTHGSGFTCHVEWTSNGSGWGTIAVQRSIHRYTEGYTTSVICGGITQMTNSSIEVIWLRGGGRYYFEADAQVTPTAQSTTYTLYSQSVTPSSSAQNDVLSAAVDTRPSFQRLNLTQSTGTAPMTVSSTTLVTNLNADLLDGYNSAETGSSIILRTQSNGYLNIDNWIQVGSAGLYSSVNSAHWTPNQWNSYSPWRIINSRGGYGGIYDDYSGVNWMHDSSGNGGLFRPANSRWFIYGHIANGCVGIGGSSTTSGYAMQVNGNSYVSGYARLAGNLYIDYNYGLGVVGLYSATRYQGIFAMGDSYKLPADGTTTGSLYGIAWSHPNAGGVAANLNTHGALVMENGTFLAAVSGSIRCRDDMRAPLFYDSNDTAYFIDPSSGQSDNQGGKIKWNFTVNGEGATTGRGLGLYPSYTSNVPTYGITFAQTANLGTHGNVTGDWVTYFTMNNSANRGWIFRDVGTPANVASISNAGRMRIASLGVNTDASATNGEIRATDNITAYYSDERLKTKLGAIENPIEKVKSLSGFYFEANETAVALGYQKKREVGVSAQEVQAILPEIIAPAPIDDKYMTVRYEKLIPLLIEAIKEQQKQIEELKSLLNK